MATTRDSRQDVYTGAKSLRPVYEQAGVAPFRIEGEEIQVLLITARSGRKWIIPKGLVEPRLSAVESARQEAMEEAGIRGKIDPRVIGEYRYCKWGGVCRVQVFPMKVEELLPDWPECDRRRRWFSCHDAVNAVRSQDLKRLLRTLPEIRAQLATM